MKRIIIAGYLNRVMWGGRYSQGNRTLSSIRMAYACQFPPLIADIPLMF